MNLPRPIHALFLSVVLAAASAACAVEQQVAATSHALWLKADGSVWAGADHNDGARGDAAKPQIRKGFKRIAGLDGVAQVMAWESSSAALMADGSVWVWGSFNGMWLESERKALPGMTRVKRFAMGDDFVVALKDDGSVWLIGDGDHGLSAGHLDSRRAAVQVKDLGTDATAVGATMWTAYAVRKDGSVWGWGSGFGNLLGPQGKWDFFSPGKDANPRPLKLPGLKDITAVSGGHLHMLALSRDGRVYSWGNNDDGALGQPVQKGVGDTAFQMPGQVQGLPRVTAISAGYDFSLALDEQGRVWAWGENIYGALGVPAKTEGGRFTPGLVPGVQGAVSIHAGHYNAFAVLADGRVMGWGSNEHDFVPFAAHAPSRQVPPTLLK